VKPVVVLFRLTTVLALVVACSSSPPALKFAPETLPEAYVGTFYDARIMITENSTPVIGFTIDSGHLPDGLSIDDVAGEENVGHIFGTPTTPGMAFFSVFVSCVGTNVRGQTGKHAYSITVR
jgi:hypothetical protein